VHCEGKKPKTLRYQAFAALLLTVAALGDVNGERWVYVLEGNGTRQRAVQITSPGDGAEVVKDGMIVFTGQPLPILEKCGGPDA
jgi:hypothetical protein